MDNNSLAHTTCEVGCKYHLGNVVFMIVWLKWKNYNERN